MFAMSIGPIERKPKEKWHLTDNKITGIAAAKDYSTSYLGMILPYDLSPEQRELMLWAWEVGFHQGGQAGEEKTQRALRAALGLAG